MSEYRNRTPLLESPPDVSLLLLAHSEQRWLNCEVIPVVDQIETPEQLPEEQLPAAAAYLEVIWAEAAGRARATDAARRHLDEVEPALQPLTARARRYHAAVRALREAAAQRVVPLITGQLHRAGEQRLQAVGERLQGELLGDVEG
jgi:hypothetical protein